jgi:transcriptional regulator with XRE-family HTH domain
MSPRDLPIAERIKALREAAGLSQQQLAERGRLSLSVVFQIEQGKRKDPKFSTIAGLADGLGMKVGELAEELCRLDGGVAKPGRPPNPKAKGEPSGEKKPRGRPRKGRT